VRDHSEDVVLHRGCCITQSITQRENTHVVLHRECCICISQWWHEWKIKPWWRQTWRRCSLATQMRVISIQYEWWFLVHDVSETSLFFTPPFVLWIPEDVAVCYSGSKGLLKAVKISNFIKPFKQIHAWISKKEYIAWVFLIICYTSSLIVSIDQNVGPFLHFRVQLFRAAVLHPKIRNNCSSMWAAFWGCVTAR
jgi:hypothetical protein